MSGVCLPLFEIKIAIRVVEPDEHVCLNLSNYNMVKINLISYYKIDVNRINFATLF